MKRLFTFAVVLISACTFSAYAAIINGTCGDNLTWTHNTKARTLVITGTGAMDNYDLEVLPPWDEYKNYIKYVTIGDSVTSIGDRAFDDYDALTSVIIGNSVTSIGNAAFGNCGSLTAIEIPNSVTTIGGEAFSLSALISVSLGNSVISIGDKAFWWCWDLASIIIPNSVTTIGDEAFNTCQNMTSVTFGKSITSLGTDAFSDCENIREVTAYMPTPPNAKKCGLNNAPCTLYVPAEYFDAYNNALWWENFEEIRPIDADYLVSFMDWDGTVLTTVGTAAGQAATAPADPVREGYTFIGWDCDFSCVIRDMIVKAVYKINQYEVNFYDWDSTLLHTDSVNYQSAATAPADPTREGYTFIGWDNDFSSITGDLDVYAQYEEGVSLDLTVIVSDQDANELSTQTITLKLPFAPAIEGFTFLYWQPVAAPIKDVITIQAVYESNVPSAAPEVFVNPSNMAQKLIRNGQVYILQEDKAYTISGQVIR